MEEKGKSTHESKNPNYYVIIDGKKVPVNSEQRKAWNSMINKTRRYARTFGTCGQPNYTKCYGDCNRCPFQQEGSFIFIDDRDHYADGFFTGKCAPFAPEKTPEQQVEDQDTLEWLYNEAERLVKQGSDILRLFLIEGMSAHQISAKTGIAKSTVVDRLNRLLSFIRNHREDLV